MHTMLRASLHHSKDFRCINSNFVINYETEEGIKTQRSKVTCPRACSFCKSRTGIEPTEPGLRILLITIILYYFTGRKDKPLTVPRPCLTPAPPYAPVLWGFLNCLWVLWACDHGFHSDRALETVILQVSSQLSLPLWSLPDSTSFPLTLIDEHPHIFSHHVTYIYVMLIYTSCLHSIF